MKNTRLFFLMLFSATILSCSSDDNDSNDEQNNDSLVGTYQLIAIDSNIPLDLNADGVFTQTDFLQELNCTSNIVIQENNDFAWGNLQIFQETEIDFEGNTTNYFPASCNNFTETGTYNATSTSIVLEYDQPEGGDTLILLIGDNNTLTAEENAFITVNNSGELESFSSTVTYTYQKI